MRRLLCIAALAALSSTGCTEKQEKRPARQEPPQPTAAPLVWTELPELPNPLGFGGPFAGTSHGALIVAGGAHFPTSLFEGGEKVWVDTVFVLEPNEPAWLAGLTLPRPLAYGASISTRDGFHLLGGCDAERCYAECMRLTWVNGKIETAPLPPLPKPCAMASAALVGQTIYVAGGQDVVKPSAALKSFWALDLSAAEPAWETLKPCPGPARLLPVAAGLGNSFYLFSGAELVADREGNVHRRYLTDAWRYDRVTGWIRLAEMPRAAVAAPSPAMPFAGDTVLVFGGDDGQYADRVQELKDQHPGFPRTILAYDTVGDRWTEPGKAPVSHVTTPLVYWQGMHIIPSGEIRPGVRSPKVYGVRPAR